MATSYKNIVITPNTGSNNEPSIQFSGANTSSNTDIVLYVYPTDNGTVSFEGSAGQLFSVTNNLSGTIFSVNDVSGIPSIEVLDTGAVKLAQYNGNVGIGIATATAKLHVAGSAIIANTSLTGTTTMADTSYITNATSGNSEIMSEWVYRRTTNGAAIGAAIADVFTTPSSLALEASSVYQIEGQLYFTKTTAGTAVWTNLFSSAPTLFTMESVQTPITGMTAATGATYTPLLLYFYAQGATTAASAATGSLTTGVNHSFKFRGTVITNAACNWRLRLTQSAGTATPLAGSYYIISKVSTSTGTFAA